MEGLNLDYEWKRLMSVSEVPVKSAKNVFEDIHRAYSEPHRHYHNLDHVAQMLYWLKEAGVTDKAGLWAVWYHDYIYQPGKQDNESLSADKAVSVMSKLGVDESITKRTESIIHATKNHKAGSVDDAFLAVLDADMAILGVKEGGYKQYCSAVRKEFKRVPGFLYKRGRRNFLSSVLDNERIYSTAWFSERFESQARHNIRAELSSM